MMLRFLAACAVIAALSLPNLACVTVRASQREHLAKRAMVDDHDPGETRYTEHERGAREGASGGTGQPGGGCGCN